MCTLIVKYIPSKQLVIASNRDENPNRPTAQWNVRGNICCPLDNVFGGTWIGVNSSGIFCAITNWDLEENFHGRGLKSRGIIVTNTLNCKSTEDVLKYWNELEAKNHKPFNIIAGDINNLYHLSNDNKEMILTKLEEGLHISTGVGFNQPVPRDAFIRKHISNTKAESESAAKAAQYLLTKYRLSISDITDAEAIITYNHDNTFNNVVLWKSGLLKGIAEVNGCAIVIWCGTNKHFKLIGKKSNIDAAVELFNRLVESVEYHCRKNQKKGAGKSWANSFKLGFVVRIIERLKEGLEEAKKECSERMLRNRNR